MRLPWTSCLLMAFLLLLGGGRAIPALAQTARLSDPFRFFRWPVEDTRSVIGGLASRHVFYAAGAGAVLFGAARFDEALTREISEISDGPFIRVVEEFGNADAVKPMAAMVLLGALMSGEERFQDAAYTSLEALYLANFFTNALKTFYGRARPWQDRGALDFQPFSGNRSFPSGHATTVFAFVTPWFLYYPSYATAGMMVLAGGTAIARMATSAHWLTDVIGGAGIGFATAYWLTRRHQGGAVKVRIEPVLGLNRAGLKLSF